MHADAPPDPPGSLQATRYGHFVALVLAAVYTFNYLDRQFLTVLQEPVKRELHLSDTQLGALSGTAFALFYTVCGLPIAALADRAPRVRIITAAAAVWSLFTALCGCATGFGALALARVGVGIGEAGGSPPSYSVLSDYFPPRRRGTALAIYSLGVPLGSMLGLVLGGLLASAVGWRAAFWTLGATGLSLTPLIPLLVREPVRGAFDGEGGAAAVRRGETAVAAMRALLRDPVLVLTGVSSGLAAFVGYGLLNWIPSLLIRAKGASLAEVATWYALPAGAASLAGTLLSGLVVDRLGRRRAGAYALVPAAAIALAAPCLAAAALAPGWPSAAACLMGPALLNNVFLAPALAVVQNRTPAHRRGLAGALLLFAMNLIGLGGGPLFVGAVSDALRPRYGAEALAHALLWLLPFSALAVAVLAATAALMRRPTAA